MIGRLIVGLVWLTLVQSEESMGMEKMAMPIEEMSAKSKRYLTHDHQPSPCPPFYPHIHMPMPMHDLRPYGPPAYPKNDVHSMPIFRPQHQYVHQPIASSYLPAKPSLQYIKPEIKVPIYHEPMQHHVQPIVVKQPIFHYQPMYQSKISHEKPPIFSYAPAYHKPMPVIWPATQVKHDYHPSPPIIVKPEPPKCAPCPPIEPIHQPIFNHHVKPAPSRIYLPSTGHLPIVKPCVK